MIKEYDVVEFLKKVEEKMEEQNRLIKALIQALDKFLINLSKKELKGEKGALKEGKTPSK